MHKVERTTKQRGEKRTIRNDLAANAVIDDINQRAGLSERTWKVCRDKTKKKNQITIKSTVKSVIGCKISNKCHRKKNKEKYTNLHQPRV